MRGPRRGHGWRVLSRGGADAGPHRWRPTAVAALEVRPRTSHQLAVRMRIMRIIVPRMRVHMYRMRIYLTPCAEG